MRLYFCQNEKIQELVLQNFFETTTIQLHVSNVVHVWEKSSSCDLCLVHYRVCIIPLQGDNATAMD